MYNILNDRMRESRRRHHLFDVREFIFSSTSLVIAVKKDSRFCINSCKFDCSRYVYVCIKGRRRERIRYVIYI